MKVVSRLLAQLPLPGLVLPSHSSSCRHFLPCVNPSSLDTCPLYRLTAFVLDESGGVQVWYRINISVSKLS